MRASLFGLLLLSACGLGCGPSVSEARLTMAPPRPSDCKLAFLQLQMTDLAPGGAWEILGHVTMSERGEQDPLSPEYREEVRPRACRMGGDGVGILLAATSEGSALSRGATMVDYVVVRHRRTDSPKQPQRF